MSDLQLGLSCLGSPLFGVSDRQAYRDLPTLARENVPVTDTAGYSQPEISRNPDARRLCEDWVP